MTAARRPLIGVSAGHHDFGDYGGVGIQRPLLAAGGLPLMFPQLPEAVDELLDRVDAVVLAPGRDIEPGRYGQTPGPWLAATDPRRDAFEFALTTAALRHELPVLGVCRGMQVLSVALGGSMVQDVRVVPEWREHPSDPGWHAWKRMERLALDDGAEVPDHPRHPIAISHPSILASALGATAATVNSFHHQALDRLGSGLCVTAVAPDGVVEAIELPGRPVLGVQWELQEEWRIDGRFADVFAWFVAAARERANRTM